MRIAVTGLGCVSTFGLGVAPFWANISEGQCGIRPIARFDGPAFRSKSGAEVPEDAVLSAATSKLYASLDWVAKIGLLAADEAIADSGLEKEQLTSSRTGAIIGGTIGGLATIENMYGRLYLEDKKNLHPMMVPRIMPSGIVSAITMKHGITGPSFLVSSACASATHAMAQALLLLRTGAIDRAVVGGTEGNFTLGSWLSWEAMRVMSSGVCRPFSKGRDGMSLGEGAAALVLENMDMAKKRGADIKAELIGAGMSSDAAHITKPDEKGAAKAMTDALSSGGAAPEDVRFINAHGTGTHLNDLTETGAIKRALGDQAHKVMVSSTKSMHGHCLGATGAVEAVATVLALKHGIATPTVNYLEQDPDCDLDYVTDGPREMKHNVALSNSFAFGGLNASLAFKRFH